MSGLIALIVLLAVVIYWWDSIRSKEIARQAGGSRCQRYGLQFLDDTVSLSKLRYRRSVNGRLQFTRLYRFEFCTNGAKRYQGNLWVTARHAHDIEMEPYAINEPDGIVQTLSEPLNQQLPEHNNP